MAMMLMLVVSLAAVLLMVSGGVEAYPSRATNEWNALQPKEAGRVQAWIDGTEFGGNSNSDFDLDFLPEGDDVSEGVAKRGSASLVTFRCVRTRASAICKNGGKGPRMTQLKNGLFLCACICPFGYENPNCEGSWWRKEQAGGQ